MRASIFIWSGKKNTCGNTHELCLTLGNMEFLAASEGRSVTWEFHLDPVLKGRNGGRATLIAFTIFYDKRFQVTYYRGIFARSRWTCIFSRKPEWFIVITRDQRDRGYDIACFHHRSTVINPSWMLIECFSRSGVDWYTRNSRDR